jgi:hypothetical protein
MPAVSRKVAAILNDDAQEKRQRRQSMADNRRRSVLSSLKGMNANKKVLPEEEDAQQWKVSLNAVELTRNYESWMKIAADNVRSI